MTPLSKSAHSHLSFGRSLQVSEDKKMKQKKTRITVNEYTREREIYFDSAPADRKVGYENTDAIFTANVIEIRRCVRASRERRPRRRNGAGIFRWKCFEFRHDDIRAQSLSWLCRNERFGSGPRRKLLKRSRVKSTHALSCRRNSGIYDPTCPVLVPSTSYAESWCF